MDSIHTWSLSPIPLEMQGQKWAHRISILIHSKHLCPFCHETFGELAAAWSTHCFSRSVTILSISSVEGTCVPWRRLLDVGKNSSPLKRQQHGLGITLQVCHIFKLNHHSWREIKYINIFTVGSYLIFSQKTREKRIQNCKGWKLRKHLVQHLLSTDERAKGQRLKDLLPASGSLSTIAGQQIPASCL